MPHNAVLGGLGQRVCSLHPRDPAATTSVASARGPGVLGVPPARAPLRATSVRFPPPAPPRSLLAALRGTAGASPARPPAPAWPASKEHLVHYLVRDHFSGHFYAEAARSTELVPAAECLLRAWSNVKEHPFCGIPKYLTVPATVLSEFIDLDRQLLQWPVELVKVTSGFQGGVRDIQTWEEEIRYRIGREGMAFEQLQDLAPMLSFLRCDDFGRKDSKTNRWRAGLREVRVPQIT